MASGEWRVTSLKKEKIPGMRREMGRGLDLEEGLEWLVLGLTREHGLSLVARRAVVGPDLHRFPRSNWDAQNAQDQPEDAERIRRAWEVRKCGAMRREFGEVAPTGSGLTNGEWWVTSLKKKQIPQA